ncbi:MAG: DNA adenine methylase, partial [Treponema sp.]|nr:DNA adenine methylase [Treponema sp.]
LSGLYMYLRNLYNDKNVKNDKSFATALFLFIRNYCYSGMFRYNSKGEFNVPYGGIGYNRKTLIKKMGYYNSPELLHLLAKTEIYNQDFETFLTDKKLNKNDFIFLDPPYDSEFSTYAKNTFNKEDQKRLANFLIDSCNAKWMMIIKNTPFILSLYENHNLNIRVFDKTYLVSFMNRNNKKTEHLLITNY